MPRLQAFIRHSGGKRNSPRKLRKAIRRREAYRECDVPGAASFLTSECQCRRGSDLVDRLKEELLALKRISDVAVMITAKEFV
jgi:hypothetical protein